MRIFKAQNALPIVTPSSSVSIIWAQGNEQTRVIGSLIIDLNLGIKNYEHNR